MTDAPTRLVIPNDLWQEITAHVQMCLPEEGCGLLGGTRSEDGGGIVSAVLPVENALHSAVRYRMEPAAQLQAFYALEERGLEMLAIFHSHPQGPEHPSPTDLSEFAYPGVLSLILYLPGGSGAQPSARDWLGRAYRIDGLNDRSAAASEVSLAIEIPL